MPLARHDFLTLRLVVHDMAFLLTCLLRGMTDLVVDKAANIAISTHMPLARHDIVWGCSRQSKIRFLLTCLLRGMTFYRTSNVLPYSFLLTCLLRGMTIHHHRIHRQYSISTHMPLARHDVSFECIYSVNFISTHMPLARHDRMRSAALQGTGNFYSHASCEAWQNPFNTSPKIPNFYSHASCEAWLDITGIRGIVETFLLTCLLRGMTSRGRDPWNTEWFLLTCLLRGMTR